MTRMGLGNMIQLASRIPKRLHREAMLAAIEEERPLQEWIAEALAEHLERCQHPKRARTAAGTPREGV
jgi:HicB family